MFWRAYAEVVMVWDFVFSVKQIPTQFTSTVFRSKIPYCFFLRNLKVHLLFEFYRTVNTRQPQMWYFEYSHFFLTAGCKR